MNQSYATRLAANQARLLTLLSWRRAGQTQTTAYRSLKRLAVKEYQQLTDERCQYHRNIEIAINN